MAAKAKIRFEPVITLYPTSLYRWTHVPHDQEPDGVLIRTAFNAGGNDYVWTAESARIAPDIRDHVGGLFGHVPDEVGYFIKFDNAFNNLPFWGRKRDFNRTTSEDLAHGKRWNTRGSINALFSHVTSATISFMENYDQRIVFAIGNDLDLHNYYRQVFVGRSHYGNGLAVDEIDGQELYLPHDSYLVLRRG